MRIVVAESRGEAAFARLHARHDVIEAPALHRDPRSLARALAAADALIVRNATLVDRELLAAAPRLRAVGRLGVGLDNIDLAACRERGVAVVVPRGANATAVAEYVMACLLHFSRPIAAAAADARAGRWRRELFTGRELAGRRLAVLGLGETGMRVARRASAFNMEVVAWAPHTPETAYAAQETGARLVELDEALESADFVSLHVPHVPATHHLLGPPELSLMGPRAVLVNAARGGLVDETALAEALLSGRLGGAALDVREKEPPPPPERDPLARLPNVLLTPHLAGHTDESLERVAEVVVRGVLRACAEGGGDAAVYEASSRNAFLTSPRTISTL